MNTVDIVGILNVFHDGSFVVFSRSGQNIEFVVDIQYLAEKIHPTFKTFKGVFMDCENIVFRISGGKEVLITDLDIISKLELEISKAELEDERIKISCFSNKEGTGGDLLITCEDFLIFDEVDMKVTFELLRKICHEYWNKLN